MTKVSICCITYNHSRYLAKAIESVLAQEFDGAIEMVIGDDCSTDGTRDIALAYQQQYPDQIKVLVHEHNLGIMPNFLATYAACDGEYVAILDGDDYWTDPTKLQRQVDALRADATCAMCFHDAEIVYEPTSTQKPSVVFSQHIAPQFLPAPTENGASIRFTQLDLARMGWIMPTASMLFRASSLPRPMPNWFAGVFSGDYTLQLLSTRHGAALYLPRIMAHYRVHEQSITVTAAKSVYQYEKRIYEGEVYQKYVFEAKNKKHADIYLSNQILGYSQYLGREGHKWQQAIYLAKYIFYYRQRLLLYVERKLRKKLN